MKRNSTSFIIPDAINLKHSTTNGTRIHQRPNKQLSKVRHSQESEKIAPGVDNIVKLTSILYIQAVLINILIIANFIINRSLLNK